ncbi:hypothetical protein R1sor_011475 [Riccia sorocarpa]|uniref:RanBP2-type domain-containing protein n=1 Tax=Riccia sorocarpa TaxID=122646 RepID=A0ABD3I711_9MARC
MYGGDESGGHYASRLPKHPRLSRVHGIVDQMNGDMHRGGKQPRPLEDGNWICEDSNCANVNYPRRTECNKCGKRRGAIGDAVVKAYIDSIKIARGELALSPQLVSGGPERLGMARGMMPHNGSDVSPQQPGISISPGSSNLVGELDPWMGGGYEQPVPSFASHYVTGDGGLSGRRSTLSAATEGKRLAEQLVASFAASSDPVGDAGECLASAALWLQTMKSRMQAGDSRALSTSSLASSIMADSNSLAQGSGSLVGTNGGVALLSQSPLNGSIGGSTGGLGSLMINSGPPGMCSSMLGSYLPRVNPANGNIPPGPRTVLPRTIRYEDYKDRPSDYLREFGDPAAVSATAMGGGHRPEPGVYGNWECEECKNVNFPRRTNCFQCHKRRGSKGEEIVRKYVRGLIEEANRE